MEIFPYFYTQRVYLYVSCELKAIYLHPDQRSKQAPSFDGGVIFDFGERICYSWLSTQAISPLSVLPPQESHLLPITLFASVRSWLARAIRSSGLLQLIWELNRLIQQEFKRAETFENQSVEAKLQISLLSQS